VAILAASGSCRPPISPISAVTKRFAVGDGTAQEVVVHGEQIAAAASTGR